MVIRGEAEIGIATETLASTPQLATFPYYTWTHGVIVPKGHDLERAGPLTLPAIAEHPMAAQKGLRYLQYVGFRANEQTLFGLL